ncbi:hypothetical protein ACSFA8_12755 [Variovorax sp. RT4R15]|uniref:hypothetical protein n=1 Tax=Variovorax sp. RT4R15 TaxID=3443737 RepID=UPI003F46DE4F
MKSSDLKPFSADFVKITGEYAVVLRRAAIAERSIEINAVLSAMEVNEISHQSPTFIAFSPIFGQEALQELSDRLVNLGLIYFDDFFEYAGTVPSWCQVAFFPSP